MFCGVIFARSARESGTSRSTCAKSTRKVRVALSGSFSESSVIFANGIAGGSGSAPCEQPPADSSTATISGERRKHVFMAMVPNSQGCQKCDERLLVPLGEIVAKRVPGVLAAAEHV